MTGTTVRITGARELRATMKRAGADMQDFTDTNAAVGAMVAADAAGRAPRRRGILASTIRASKAKTKATVRAGGARVRYAGVQEYGWPARHIRPHPFLTAAASSTEPAWTTLYFTRLEQIVAKVRGA